MIRKTLILLWMLFPVGVAAYHFNAGPKQMMRESAHARLMRIRALAQEEEPNWPEIISQYGELTQELPPDEEQIVFHQIQLAVAEARLEMLDLDVAIEDLTRLLQEAAVEYGENAPITRGIREQLGKAHYYATWVLKTNGAAESEWRPFAERARQLFRFLAELEDPAEFERYEERVRQEFDRAVRRTASHPPSKGSPS
jgi:hypothetical protein